MRTLATIVTTAFAIAASGCYVGGDSPADEENTPVVGEASALVSSEEPPAADPPDEGGMAPPAIVAVCNSQLDLYGQWQNPATADDCSEQGVAGLRVGSGWGLAVLREGMQGDTVEYRFDDGPIVRVDGTSERNAFSGLAPGRHTIEARAQRGERWTAWSAPYTFTTVNEVEILAVCNARWDPELDQLQQPGTAAECRTAAADGLRTGSGWDWQPYTRGIVELADVTFRFDGGAGFGSGSEGSAAFAALTPGRHTIEAREQRPWGWTDWSDPYEFETVAVLEVIAICTLAPGQAATYAGCKAGGARGLRSFGGWVDHPGGRRG